MPIQVVAVVVAPSGRLARREMLVPLVLLDRKVMLGRKDPKA